MRKLKPNTCSRFVFPLLGIPRDWFYCYAFNRYGYPSESTRFRNCYFYDPALPHLTHGFAFLVHSNEQDLDFDKFETKLVRHQGYVDGYDICDGRFGVKLYRIPEVFKEDYQKILDGQYSKLSKEAIVAIVRNAFYDKETAIKIMNKDIDLKEEWERALDVDLKDQEVWPIYTDKYQLLKETISVELKELLHKESMVPNGEFE